MQTFITSLWALNPGYRSFDHYLETPLNVSLRPGHERKNLVYILVESFERQVLGEFQRYGYKSAMPFVTHTTQTGMFVPNVELPLRAH